MRLSSIARGVSSGCPVDVRTTPRIAEPGTMLWYAESEEVESDVGKAGVGVAKGNLNVGRVIGVSSTERF